MKVGESALLDRALRALADGGRRAILNEVRAVARPVGDVAARVEMSQQAVSHHLGVLEKAGLVTQTRDGARHLFAVRTEGLRVVEDYLGEFWPEHLRRLKEAAETTARRRERG
jgi:DNA-binding transcriptional ArsR family regulator